MEITLTENEVENKPPFFNPFLGQRQSVFHSDYNLTIRAKDSVPLSKLNLKSRSISTASNGEKGYCRRREVGVRFLRRKKVRKRVRRSKKRRRTVGVIIVGGYGRIKAAIKGFNQKKKDVLSSSLLKVFKPELVDGIRERISKSLGFDWRSVTAIKGDRSVFGQLFSFPLVQEIICRCNDAYGGGSDGVLGTCESVLREEKEEMVKRRVWARMYDCVEDGLTRKWPSYEQSLHFVWKQILLVQGGAERRSVQHDVCFKGGCVEVSLEKR